MQIKPLQDRVVIEPLLEESTSTIIIPDNSKQKPSRGKVVAVGPGARNSDGSVNPISLKEGDTVLYSEYAGKEIKIEDKELLVVNEGDVLATLN